MRTIKTESYVLKAVDGEKSEIYTIIARKDGISEVGTFIASISSKYDNINVFRINIEDNDVFKEAFLALYQEMGMPIFFWSEDRSLSIDQRMALLEMGAKFCKDEAEETRWYAEKNRMVYQLGEHKN